MSAFVEGIDRGQSTFFPAMRLSSRHGYSAAFAAGSANAFADPESFPASLRAAGARGCR
jgi:hypothetical protein